MTEMSGQGWVVCLCAQWCNVCRGLRENFDALALALPGVRLAWVDVEDEETLMGDFDIETFPTVLMGSDTQLRFAGAVQPQAAVIARLATGLLGPDGLALDNEEAMAVLRRVIASRT